MTLPAGVIAAIVVVVIIGVMLFLGLMYYYIRKKNEDESCAKLFEKYTTVRYKAAERSEMVGDYPQIPGTFIKTPVPGQQFTARELSGAGGDGFVIPTREVNPAARASMLNPIDPEDIDPTMYSDEYQVEGSQHKAGKRPPQVIFNVEYDEENSIMKICILEARHLVFSSTTGSSDPYCVVGIKPGHVEKQSKVLKNTKDPSFNETFSFVVTKEEFNQKSIEIKFFEFDQHSRHELVGTVFQRLDELELKHGKVDLWRRITLARPTTSEAAEEYGDILLRLGYLPSAEKLTVVLLKARNLKPITEVGESKPPDPYIRVAILHDGNLLKKKKTSTKRKTANPTYNQAINFAIPLDVLPQIEIQFFVVHDYGVKIQRGSRKETIGYLEISQHAKGDEYDHWVDLMSNKPQARWHRLVKGVQEETEETTEK